MAKTLIDTRDVRFVLFEQLEIDKCLSPELREEYDSETLEMVVNEAEKLAVNVIAPTNKDGDKIGCRFKEGKVSVPPSFQKAYDLVCEGGWNVISDPMESGGQGLPKAVEICCREYFEAANVALSNYMNLTHGAGKLIEIFGTSEQKENYLEKLYTGEWCGTMCITEPDAGSDVGAIKTSAERNPDGTYSIKGTKIFITGGDHNLVENIIHMVLARIEGDPPGTRGLSLFLVPKLRVSDGNIGEPNDVMCTGIEEKMGIHGSPTCSLNFGDEDNCIGYLVGKEQQGIMVMFHMMNEARQMVGSQGLGVGSAAYLEALSYAVERIQGVNFSQTRNPDAPKVPIIEHPDIRFSLMKMKALVEGCRGLVYYHAHCMDRAEIASTDEEKGRWQGMVELLTPVCKAYSTDRSIEICSAAIQVLGGYGYSSEFPVEQYLRDVRITPIYEGTNGIQGIDLLTRKVVMKKGSVFQTFLSELDKVIAKAGKLESLSEYASIMEKYKAVLEEGRDYLTKEMKEDSGIAMSKATRFLEFFGDITLGWLWLWQVVLAEQKVQAILEQKGKTMEELDTANPGDKELAYYTGKIETGKFYLERVLPGVIGKLEEIKSEGEDFLQMAVDCF